MKNAEKVADTFSVASNLVNRDSILERELPRVRDHARGRAGIHADLDRVLALWYSHGIPAAAASPKGESVHVGGVLVNDGPLERLDDNVRFEIARQRRIDAA